MTEQQQHLESILKQAQDLSSEMQQLQRELSNKQQLFTKLQGIVEYLTEIGVKLPESNAEEPAEPVVAEVAEEEPAPEAE